MKRMYRLLMSIFLISILVATATTNTKDIKDTKNDDKLIPDVSDKNNVVEETIPIDIAVPTIDQLTYTDVWTNYSTKNIYLDTLDMPTEVFSNSITLRFPSTITVAFSSQVDADPFTGAVDILYSSYIRIYITVDGVKILPGDIMFRGIGNLGSSNDSWVPNSYTFFKNYLPVGTHKIKVYAHWDADHRFFSKLGSRTLIITANGYGH